MISKLRKRGEFILLPVVILLEKAGATPNVVTALSLILSVPTFYLLLNAETCFALPLLVLVGMLDWADGTIAARTGKGTEFGKFFDSFSDRMIEGGTYACIAIGYDLVPHSFAALITSYLVSYVAAKSPIELKELGIGTRGERLIVLMSGLFLSIFIREILGIALLIITFLASITLVQRVGKVLRTLSKD